MKKKKCNFFETGGRKKVHRWFMILRIEKKNMKSEYSENSSKKRGEVKEEVSLNSTYRRLICKYLTSEAYSRKNSIQNHWYVKWNRSKCSTGGGRAGEGTPEGSRMRVNVEFALLSIVFHKYVFVRNSRRRGGGGPSKNGWVRQLIFFFWKHQVHTLRKVEAGDLWNWNLLNQSPRRDWLAGGGGVKALTDDSHVLISYQEYYFLLKIDFSIFDYRISINRLTTKKALKLILKKNTHATKIQTQTVLLPYRMVLSYPNMNRCYISLFNFTSVHQSSITSWAPD